MPFTPWTPLAGLSDVVLLVARRVMGAAMVYYGWPKVRNPARRSLRHRDGHGHRVEDQATQAVHRLLVRSSAARPGARAPDVRPGGLQPRSRARRPLRG